MTEHFSAQYDAGNLSLLEMLQRLQNDFGIYESMDRILANTGQRAKYLTIHPETHKKYFGEFNPVMLMSLRIVKDEHCPKDSVHVSVEPFKLEDVGAE